MSRPPAKPCGGSVVPSVRDVRRSTNTGGEVDMLVRSTPRLLLRDPRGEAA